MKNWEKKWRLYVANLENAAKIIAENVEEAKGDPKGGDKLMRRDVEKDPRDDMRADPLITDWCKKLNYFPYQTMKNEWNPFLGEGAQGRVYGVTKNGKLYAVKLVSKSHGHGAEEEWKTRNRFASIYTTMPNHVRKHFPKIYDMGEYDADENVAEEGNTEYYYYVMEFLQPLESRYEKYFQGAEGGRNNANKYRDKPHAVNAEEYDIFSTERYGDLRKAYIRILTKVATTSDHFAKIFTKSGSEVPWSSPDDEAYRRILSQIMEFADEVLYQTWSRDLNKALFARMKNERELESSINAKLVANYEKKSAAAKKLASKLSNAGLASSKFGPNIIKKFRALSIELALSELNKFMSQTFGEFAKYISEQSVPYVYSKSGEPGSGDFHKTRDVDLLRSGPVTEFRQAMIYAARNYDLSVSDIRGANVMQRGKDIVMVDIGLW